MNEKLWSTSLREIELCHFEQDRYRRYHTVNRVSCPRTDEICLICSDHLSFLWEKNSIFYLIKTQNNKGRFQYEEFCDYRLSNLVEFFTFERFFSQRFRKEGTLVCGYFILGEEEEAFSDVIYQYCVKKLEDLSIMAGVSEVQFTFFTP